MKHVNCSAAAVGLAFDVRRVCLRRGQGPGEQESGDQGSGGPDAAETAPAQTESAAAPEAASPEPTSEPTEEAEPAAEDINGRWCVVDESIDDAFACVTIELPNATYDEGTTVDITAHDSPWEKGEGVFEFAMADAPFGTYYPAGVPIEGFTDMGQGPDLVEEDRIWNSQDGFYAVRQ